MQIRAVVSLTAVSALWLPTSQSFVGRHPIQRGIGTIVASDCRPNNVQRRTTSSLAALTERQMQFWEDVDTGLNDIENFYAKKGQDIDRIRTFAKT